MKKKLDTRFPAARIKKIMQTDEDVGKIAMAVPLLVSKALELFLQDLCDRTYDITLRKGAKTVNSFHLKQCVQTFNIFDFLKDVVRKVPDLGGHVATADDRTVTKRRKFVEDNENNSDEETRKNKMPEPGHTGSRGRGKGRGRGRGRGSRKVDQEMTAAKSEVSPDTLKQIGNKCTQSNECEEDLIEPEEAKEIVPVSKMAEMSVRNFDLNMDLDENGESATLTAPVPVGSPAKLTAEFKHEEFPGWSLSDVQKMAIHPMQLASLNSRVDEDEEDYDEES